jgi:hypothetical protein
MDLLTSIKRLGTGARCHHSFSFALCFVALCKKENKVEKVFFKSLTEKNRFSSLLLNLITVSNVKCNRIRLALLSITVQLSSRTRGKS